MNHALSKSSKIYSPFQNRKFYKLQALGNSYIVLDSLDWPESDLETTDWMIALCSEEWGIGSDGILWGPNLKEGESHHAKLRIFNKDGSEAEKSGNGIRIFSRYLRDLRQFPQEFKLHTLGGEVSVIDKGLDGIRVHMGFGRILSSFSDNKKEQPSLEKFSFENKSFSGLRVSMGNPHCVLFEGFPALNEDLMRLWGPRIESDSLFPDRTNVQFAKVKDRKTLSLQIWERGSGYTLASGSSSCAAAFAAYKMGWVDQALCVEMPGGTLSIEIESDDQIWMQGDVEWICEGQLR